MKKPGGKLTELTANFTEGLFNIFLFLPYFFSVSVLLTTLFKPWKNLVGKKEDVGFSFEEWFNRLSFNLISRVMGFFMRISILIFFLMMEVFYVILLPILVLAFIVLIPFTLLASVLVKSEEERKRDFKDAFIKSHSLTDSSKAPVEEWFEKYYEVGRRQKKWWKLENLFAIPPLARDWAYGYTPALDKYTDDLTDAAHQARIQSAVDRVHEISEIERTLVKNSNGNVILVGEEGIGKHTIVDALAKRIYEGTSNNLLAYKRILKLNLERILSEELDQKKRELFVEELFQEAYNAGNIMLFIENFDRVTTTSKDRVDLTIPIKKFAESSNFHILATTTPFMYQKFVTPREDVSQLFTQIQVSEISKEDAITILKDLTPTFEKKNGVVIPYETLINTVEKSDYYITDVPFPEKAINLLDASCALARQQNIKNPEGLVVVAPATVDSVIIEKTHVPTQLDDILKEKLLSLKAKLATWVIEQPTAVDLIEKKLQSSFVLLGKRKKPLASFLFLGPTGVGKTETSKALSSIFFGDEKHLLRFDMSSFQRAEDIPQLVGSMDKQLPGLMTQKIREIPYGVLLLDEIEKAHKDLTNLFLTILDEGYFIDGYGKRVDCRHLIVIATSNAGSDKLLDGNIQQDGLLDFLVDNGYFVPEFLNRFDGVVLYGTLTEQGLYELGKKFLTEIAASIYNLHKVRLTVSDETLRTLISSSYKPELGARNMYRTINSEIEAAVAKKILDGTAREGSTITI